MGFETPSGENLIFQKLFEKINADDRREIEADIFNASGGIPLETAFEQISDEKIARALIDKCEFYLKLKRDGEPAPKLKTKAKEISKEVERAAFPD